MSPATSIEAIRAQGIAAEHEQEAAAQVPSEKARQLQELLATKLNRQIVGSLVGCIHCGMCNESCHYVLANPDDPTMTVEGMPAPLRVVVTARSP